jgi:uncharacterized protein involved in exopolysaccharide biosynthesis/Mrp family chromosome partitioning ATPase
LCAVGAALAFASTTTPRYRAETRLLIETRESVFTRPESGQSEQPVLDDQGVTSQVQVVSSTEILAKVAEQLGLAKLPEFDEGANSSGLQRLLVIAGLKSDPGIMAVEERVIRRMREKLNVYRVEGSRVIVIEFSSEDPKLAAEIPNLIADTYIASQGNAKLESNAAATEWLAPEIEDLSKRVKEAEAKVAAYRGQSDILVGQNNSVLATQQLAELSSELSRLRASRAAAEATADSVRQALQNGGSLDALPEVMSSGLIQRLRERQIQLQSEITDLSTTLLDNHPRIRALRSQLTGLDAQIQSEARKVLSGLMTEAETAKARENQLLAEVNQLKAASARAGEQEVELNALEREAAAQRQLLETYLTRYREASARQDRNYLPVDARVFSRAVAPAEPYFPKVLPIVSAAFFGTILIMAIITLLRELFSGRAMRPAPVPHPVQKQEPLPEPAATALPVSIPFAATGQAEDTAKPLQEAQAQQAEPLEEPAESEPLPDPEPVMTSEIAEPTAQTMQEDPVVAEDVPLTVSEDSPGVEPALPQQIVTEMEPALMEEGPAPVSATPATRLDLGEVGIDTAVHKLIESGASRAVFVSPEGDEAAASAIMVARDIADAGLRVVLVDLTASGAVSGAMLESLTLPGITDLLAGDAQFTDVLHPDHFSDCHIMPVGVADPIRAMRAASRLPVILQSLAAAYDLVVVECGPTDAQGIRRLASSEAEVFISLLDPDDVALSAAANIIRDGFPDAILVTPVDSHTPRGPMPGTRAA